MRFLTRTLLLAAALLPIGNPQVLVGTEILAIPPDWLYSGGEAASVRSEVTDLIYDGARAQALKIVCVPLQAGDNLGKAGTNNQSFKLDLAEYHALSFKAKFIGSGGAREAFTIRLSGPGVSLSKTFSTEDVDKVPAKDGFYAFRWDFAKSVKPNARLAGMTVCGDYQNLPQGGRLEVSLIDFGFERSAAEAPTSTIPVSPWVQSGKIQESKVPLQGWTVDKSEVAGGIQIKTVQVKVNGQTMPALQLTYQHGEKYSPVSLPFKINADDYNVFALMAKVEIPANTKALGDIEAPMTGWYSYQFNAFFDNFGIAMQEADGLPWAQMGVPSTHFLQHLDKNQPKVDGFRAFRWDMKNENRTGNKGFDLEKVASVKFFYDNRKIKPGEQVVITIVDPRFIKGLARTGGDTERYAAFRKTMDQYKPDYSDSTSQLGAPKEGRLPEPLPLVKDGRPLGEIVGVSSVWSPEGNAVNELYRWLYPLTGGVKIPVVAKPTDQDNLKIFVGQAFAAKLFPEDITFLKGSDGCAIRTRGKNVYIFGATQKGTLNGVYTFLEGNSDIIWPRPSNLFGSVYTENPELAIVWGEYRNRPEARNWGWMGKTSGPGLDYQIRNRSNYVGLRSDVSFKYWGLFMEEGGGHNLHSWIPWSLWKTNPEYWCQIDGERRHPDAYKNQICLTNSKGRGIFIDRLLETIERNPQMAKADCFNIKIEDNWGSCECEECVRPIRLPDGTLLKKEDMAFRSTQFFMFLNEVADAVHNRGYPRMQIGTYVYFFTVPVPKVPVTSALRPYFCDYVRKDYKVPIFAPINDLWWKMLNEWTKVSDKVVIREYTGLYVYFRPLAEVAAYDIRAELDAGAREFTSESLPVCSTETPVTTGPGNRDLDVSAMEYWVISRLYWEPDANVEQLRKYFIRRTFREAAPEIERFYGTIRQLYFKEKRTTDFDENQETLRLVIAQNKEDELRGYLTAALKNVKHPLSRKMIEQIRDAYELWVGELKAKNIE